MRFVRGARNAWHRRRASVIGCDRGRSCVGGRIRKFDLDDLDECFDCRAQATRNEEHGILERALAKLAGDACEDRPESGKNGARENDGEDGPETHAEEILAHGLFLARFFRFFSAHVFEAQDAFEFLLEVLDGPRPACPVHE